MEERYFTFQPLVHFEKIRKMVKLKSQDPK